jgi:hypothetical protein
MTNRFNIARKNECHMRPSQGAGFRVTSGILGFRNRGTRVVKRVFGSDIQTGRAYAFVKLWMRGKENINGILYQTFLKRRPKFDL